MTRNIQKLYYLKLYRQYVPWMLNNGVSITVKNGTVYTKYTIARASLPSATLKTHTWVANRVKMLMSVLLINSNFYPIFLHCVVIPRKCLATAQLVGRGISVIAMTIRGLGYSNQSSVQEISSLAK